MMATGERAKYVELLTTLLAKSLAPVLTDLTQHLDEMERYAGTGNHALAIKHAHYLIVNHQGTFNLGVDKKKVYDTFEAAVRALRQGRLGPVRNVYYGLDRLCADVERITQQNQERSKRPPY